MVRLYRSFTLLLCLSGCSASGQGAIPLSATPIRSSRTVQIPSQPSVTSSRSLDAAAAGACCAEDTASSNEYGCRAGDICPQLAGDVRMKEGYRVISTETAGGSPVMHVADTCQHYHCAVDMVCVEKGGSEVTCMQPWGCVLVQRLDVSGKS